MVLKQKQKARRNKKKRKESLIKRLLCDNCGQKALVGSLAEFTSCTDPVYVNKPGASLYLECLSCGMHTFIRVMTSDEITNLVMAAKKDGRILCPNCNNILGRIDGEHEAWVECPRCGARV